MTASNMTSLTPTPLAVVLLKPFDVVPQKKVE
jgi:hypothetical protein